MDRIQQLADVWETGGNIEDVTLPIIMLQFIHYTYWNHEVNFGNCKQ